MKFIVAAFAVCVLAAAVASSEAAGHVSASPCISTDNPLKEGMDLFPTSVRITSADSAPDDTEVTIADDFSVSYHKTFKVVKTLCGTFQPDDCKPQTYILTMCGAPTPTKMPNGDAFPEGTGFFNVPIAGVATGLTIPITFVEMLGALDKIKVVDPANIHSPCLQKMEEEGIIVGHGSSDHWSGSYKHKANWTKLINTTADVHVAFTDSFGSAASGTDKDVVFDASSDPGALNRAEWIKFVATFFNLEHKANLYFAREAAAYNTISSKMKLAAAAAGVKKSCAWVSDYKWTVSWTSYKKDYCEAAGMIAWVNATLDADKKVSQSFATAEEFHAAVADVDILIDESYFPDPRTATAEEVKKKLKITADTKLKALTSPGKLLRLDKHVSDGDTKFFNENAGNANIGMDWYESAIARPALVLADLSNAAAPDVILAPPAGCSRYFRDVLKGDMPIVTSKKDCNTWSAADAESKCLTNSVKDADVAPPSPPPSPPPPTPPPPPATATVASSMEISGYTAETFGTAEKAAFARTVASAADVNVAAVTVLGVSDASGASRRRLAAAHAATGVKVDFEIAVAGTEAGTEVGRVLTDFVENKPELLIKTMKEEGLSKVTSVKILEKPAVANNDKTSVSGVAPRTTFGAVVLAVAAALLW